MPMTLRSTSALVAFLLVFSACGDTAADTSTSTTSTTTLSATTSTTAVPASTTSTGTGTTSAAPSTTAVPAVYPRFEPEACRDPELSVAARAGTYDVECGHVVVPENRDDPTSQAVYLPVVITRSQNPDAEPDPVIYLAGGGGHDHLSAAYPYLGWVGDAILETRDFIQYNQRGAPRTTPELICPGYTDFLYRLAARPELSSVWTADNREYLDECRQALHDRGIDLTQYNTAVNAADARDVMIALGYEQANYYGTSYGTRIGLDLIRDYPEVVRSIILDSVYPPEIDYYSEYALFMQRAFNMVFAACAADPGCAAAYPDLEGTFFDAVDRYNTDPVVVETSFGPVSVDGGVFMDAVAIFLYSPEWIPRSAKAIASAADGDLGLLRTVVVGAIDLPGLSWSMWYAMQCREEVPFESYEQAVTMAADLPKPMRDHFVDGFSRFPFEMCADSLSGVADPIESVAVTSDVPALVFAGAFDPATPPHWGEGTARALANATYLYFPALGHGVMRSNDCGLQIGLAFIADPSGALDTSCMADIPPVVFETG